MRALIALALTAPLLCAAPAHAFVYWAEPQVGTIGRANNDGTGVDNGFIHTGGQPIAVAVNSSHIYWANDSAGTIGRANIDGTGVEPNFITGIKEPWGVAVNSSSIYWASLEGHEIGRANLDGTGKNLGLVTGTDSPCSIAIDSGHIYWGNSGLTSYIGRASLTGNTPENEWVNLGTYTPCGMADNSANVFFANTGFLGGFSHEIGRVDINGTVVNKSIIGDADGPCGLTVNGSQLYWANQGNGTIGVANTDSTAVNEDLIATGGGEICGVAVNNLAPPPTPTPEPPRPTPVPPSNAFTLGKVKPNRKLGTATVTVTVSSPGRLSLQGKGIVKTAAGASPAAPTKLIVKPTGKAKKTLRKAGRAKVKATFTFSPTGGTPRSATKAIVLKKKLP